jgi:hypothetical protein
MKPMLRTDFLVLVKVFDQREDFVTENLEHFPRFEVLKPSPRKALLFLAEGSGLEWALSAWTWYRNYSTMRISS